MAATLNFFRYEKLLFKAEVIEIEILKIYTITLLV